MQPSLHRRHLLQSTAATCLAASIAKVASAASATFVEEPFSFRYLLGSSLYGYASIESILLEAPKLHCASIDLWPRVHGDQREQLDAMGEEAFQKARETLPARFCWHCGKPLHARTGVCPFCGEPPGAA